MSAQDGMSYWASQTQRGWTVLAFLFAPPDTAAVRELKNRIDFFDIETGTTWDLFFPGYYRTKSRESDWGGNPILRARNGDYWYWSPEGFKQMADHIFTKTRGSWHYSGGTDLVLLNALLDIDHAPTIDWESVASGQVTDGERGVFTMSLGEIVQAITRDLEDNLEDSNYGVGRVVSQVGDQSSALAEYLGNLVSSIIASITTSWIMQK